MTLPFKDVSIVAYNGNKVEVSVMLLNFALPHLNVEVENERILLEKEYSTESLAKLVNNLFCEGEIFTDSLQEQQNLIDLCHLLNLNVSYRVHQVVNDDEDHHCDSIHAEGLDDIGSPKKVKSKRQFTSALSTVDLTCDICDRVFTAMYKLKIHKLIHSSSPPFVCSQCGRGFNNKYKMRSHEKKHASDSKEPFRLIAHSGLDLKGLTCEKCHALFDTKKSLKDHIEAAHPLFHASTHSCHLCHKVFKGLKGLKNHTANVDCQRKVVSGDKSKPRKQDNLLKCLKCPVLCATRKSLKIHTRTAHWKELGEEAALPFRCLPCDKGFLKQSYFEEHQNRFHSVVKPFACMYCPKRCATKQDRDRHLSSHLGKASFHCAFCVRSFVHRASLTRHQRIHLGERPYHCQVCGKNFGLLSVLRKHQKFHEKKGDRTQIVTAPKGQRGAQTYTYIAYAEIPPIKNQTQFMGEYQTEQQIYQVMEINNQEETESIAMDILGLLGDEQQEVEKPLEETLHKIQF